jgi:hypothetical protein
VTVDLSDDVDLYRRIMDLADVMNETNCREGLTDAEAADLRELIMMARVVRARIQAAVKHAGGGPH